MVDRIDIAIARKILEFFSSDVRMRPHLLEALGKMKWAIGLAASENKTRRIV